MRGRAAEAADGGDRTAMLTVGRLAADDATGVSVRLRRHARRISRGSGPCRGRPSKTQRLSAALAIAPICPSASSAAGASPTCGYAHAAAEHGVYLAGPARHGDRSRARGAGSTRISADARGGTSISSTTTRGRRAAGPGTDSRRQSTPRSPSTSAASRRRSARRPQPRRADALRRFVVERCTSAVSTGNLVLEYLPNVACHKGDATRWIARRRRTRGAASRRGSCSSATTSRMRTRSARSSAASACWSAARESAADYQLGSTHGRHRTPCVADARTIMTVANA